MDAFVAIGRVGLVVAGIVGVMAVASAALKTFVVPRALAVPFARVLWVASRRVFLWLAARAARRGGEPARDHVLALYAPVTLMVMLGSWLAVLLASYTAIFLGLDDRSLRQAFELSGSSLFTLGFARPTDAPSVAVAFTEASLGVGLVAVFVTYLPSIYAAFGRREAAVALLEARADSPPSAETMLVRMHRTGMVDHLDEMWGRWEEWFVDLDESHTSLVSLPFFRSPQAERSWVTAAGAVLDAAALSLAVVDRPNVPAAHYMLRSGFVSLRRISDSFEIPYDPSPSPGDPISVTRTEFDACCDRMAAAGVPLKADRDRAWRDFSGWRVNYDAVLLGLAGLTSAPRGVWSSDRAPADVTPPIRAGRRSPRRR